jgi:hypothetical protein
MQMDTTILLWIAAGLCFAVSAWTIVAAIVAVVRGTVRPWQLDAVVAVLFHGTTALAALKLASLALNGGMAP